MKKSLGYSVGTVIATLAMVVSLASPAAADSHHESHSSGTHVKNSYNTTTTTNTETTTNTITTTTTISNTKTNNGIIQTQKAGNGGETEGKQTAIQGNYSGVYKVHIDQHQTTSQVNSNSNVAGPQVNDASVNHNLNAGVSLLSHQDGSNSTTQNNSLTNDNSQALSQSNSNNQSQVVSQTATGVSL